MMRNHLGMESAVLIEIQGDDAIFRVVDTVHPDRFQVNDVWSTESALCAQVLVGNLPEIIPDVAKNARAAALPMTRELGIGAMIAMGVRNADATSFGMLCFVSSRPEPTLAERDLGAIKLLTRLVEREVQRRQAAFETVAADRNLVESLIENGEFEVYAQPITDLRSSKVSGYEALCRFAGVTDAPPEAVFDLAGDVGLRTQLETEIIRQALASAAALPGRTYLSVNASPNTVFAPGFGELFAGHDLCRVYLEMTEHQEVRDYPGLLKLLEPLRATGLRIAVDDAGTGFSGLYQIVQLQPDMIKLDRALVAGIDGDQAKRAMCAAMVHYAGESGAFLVAEGVETEAEAAELVRLGVSHAQGYHFGRPIPLNSLTVASTG